MPIHSRVNYEVVQSVMDFCDIKTILAIRAISPTFDRLGAQYLSNAYNTALSRFVVDHVGFRAILRSIGAVISGSFALHLLDRDRADRWTPADLDVYTPALYGRRLIYYLLEVEHFVVLRHKHRHYTFSSRAFAHVVTLVRGNIKLDVIISSSASPLFPISHFWGTHVMNFVTADGFCIAYPDFTLQGRALLHPSGLVARLFPRAFIRALMAKYEGRGYDFRVRYSAWARASETSWECDGGSGCARTVRFFGDRSCLVGSFNAPASELMWPGGLENEGLTVSLPSAPRLCLLVSILMLNTDLNPTFLYRQQRLQSLYNAVLAKVPASYPFAHIPRSATWAFDPASFGTDGRLTLDGAVVRVHLVGVPLFEVDAEVGRQRFSCKHKSAGPTREPLKLTVDASHVVPDDESFHKLVVSRGPVTNVFDATLCDTPFLARIHPITIVPGDVVFTVCEYRLRADPFHSPCNYLTLCSLYLLECAEDVRVTIFDELMKPNVY